jgi:hypothetical protein
MYYIARSLKFIILMTTKSLQYFIQYYATRNPYNILFNIKLHSDIHNFT